MNSISIDGHKYAKATDIARELGYTADYVGQLCRAKKVDAQLVGRSWYVSEDSLRAYKKTRYRNDKKITHKTIKQNLQSTNQQEEDVFGIPVTTSKYKSLSKKYNHRKLHLAEATHTYYEDNTDLLPISSTAKRKEGRLRVSHADEQKIKIKSKSKAYNFNPTTPPEIRFSGELAIYEVDSEDFSEVSSLQSEEDQADELTQKIHVQKKMGKSKTLQSKDIKSLKISHKKRTRVKSQSLLLKEQELESATETMTQKGHINNPIGGTLQVATIQRQGMNLKGSHIVITTLLCSIMIATLLFGMQSVVFMEGSQVTTAYTFDIQTVVATVLAAW